MLAKSRIPAGKLAVGKIASRDEAVLNDGGLRAESVVYDFTVDGGAAGDVAFGRKLPEGAVIKALTVVVVVAVAGAIDAVVKAGSVSLTAATNLTTLSGVASIALTDTDGILLAVDSELKLTIATPASAGEFRLFVEYLLPND